MEAMPWCENLSWSGEVLGVVQNRMRPINTD